MPSGYTADVQNGKITTLRQFAMQCARGFSALIMMRDDPWDAPIPERIEPDTRFYDEGIVRARAVLDEVPGLSAEECEKRAAAEYEAELASHLKCESERYTSKIRYESMKQRVEDWIVGDTITGLRDFMREQLTNSIEFDCGYTSAPPIRLTGEVWRTQQLEKASRELASHSKHRNEEIQRTAGRNEWLAALRAALPPEERG